MKHKPNFEKVIIHVKFLKKWKRQDLTGQGACASNTPYILLKALWAWPGARPPDLGSGATAMAAIPPFHFLSLRTHKISVKNNLMSTTPYMRPCAGPCLFSPERKHSWCTHTPHRASPVDRTFVQTLSSWIWSLASPRAADWFPVWLLPSLFS